MALFQRSEPARASNTLLLAVVFAGAAVLRLVGVCYGLPFGGLLNPDELNVLPRAGRMVARWRAVGGRWAVGWVAAAGLWSRDKVRVLVERFIEPPQFGVLGEPRVNVLLLNLALDNLSRR